MGRLYDLLDVPEAFAVHHLAAAQAAQKEDRVVLPHERTLPGVTRTQRGRGPAERQILDCPIAVQHACVLI